MTASLITVWNGKELFWSVEEHGDALDIELLTPLADADVAEATEHAAREFEALL